MRFRDFFTEAKKPEEAVNDNVSAIHHLTKKLNFAKYSPKHHDQDAVIRSAVRHINGGHTNLALIDGKDKANLTKVREQLEYALNQLEREDIDVPADGKKSAKEFIALIPKIREFMDFLSDLSHTSTIVHMADNTRSRSDEYFNAEKAKHAHETLERMGVRKHTVLGADIDDKDGILKNLLTRVKRGQRREVEEALKILKANNIKWPELKSIEKSIDADGKH